MATPSKGTQEKALGVVTGVLILLGLYGLYQFLSGTEEVAAEPPGSEPAAAEARPAHAPVRPRLPPSGKASQPPKGVSGGGGGPGGAFQVTEPGDGTTPERSSNPFASGGAGKRQGSGGGNAGGGL